MKQVESDDDWYLMCPDECPGLNDVWGSEYEDLFWKYVHLGKFRKKVKARELMLFGNHNKKLEHHILHTKIM